MHHVTESILVGNLEDAQHPPAFVSAVLFLAENAIIAPQGLTYTHVPLKEFGEARPEDVKQAVDWLESHADGHRMLVCCRAGMGRSVSMVIAYLCCVKGMGYGEAVQLLKERRPGATPIPNLEQTIEKVRHLRQTHAGSSTQEAPPSPGGSGKSSRSL
jgi:protein-tyrosine phosphatase